VVIYEHNTKNIIKQKMEWNESVYQVEYYFSKRQTQFTYYFSYNKIESGWLGSYQVPVQEIKKRTFIRKNQNNRLM